MNIKYSILLFSVSLFFGVIRPMDPDYKQGVSLARVRILGGFCGDSERRGDRTAKDCLDYYSKNFGELINALEKEAQEKEAKKWWWQRKK